MNTLIFLILLAAQGAIGYRRFLRYLHTLQQDEYSIDRFYEWFRSRQAFDRKASIPAVAAWFLGMFGGRWWHLLLVLAAAGIGTKLILDEPDPRREGKVRLNLTPRAWRLLAVAGLIQLFAVFVLLLVPARVTNDGIHLLLLHAVLVQIIPLSLVAAVKILSPDERRRQAQFLAEARQKIRTLAPVTIGITGSYGKTSASTALTRLLNVALGPAYAPRPGVNTLMGHTREIRERLRPEHRFAVVEMAAYREGSIETLCDLAPPRVALITAIGVMHLERFGSRETIYKAKTELARAVAQDGILVLNGDCNFCRRAANQYPKDTTLLYGITSKRDEVDCWLGNLSWAPEGSRGTLVWQGREYDLVTALLGRAALSNILGAFTVAAALGASPDLLLAAIRGLDPVDNRLSLLRKGEALRLMDAYNSNPTGFEVALEVLESFPGETKILMTPGMVELGSIQADENRRVAEGAARVCTHAIIVGDTNQTALVAGLKTGGMSADRIFTVPTRDAAFAKLAELEGKGSVTLIENDLGDWYEDTTSF